MLVYLQIAGNGSVATIREADGPFNTLPDTL